MFPFNENSGVVFPDIGERKKIESRVQTERQKFEAIFFNSVTPMAIFRGPEFIVERLNSQYEALLSGREVFDKTFLEALPDYSDTVIFEVLKEVFKTGIPKNIKSYPIYIKNKTSRKMEEHFLDGTFVRMDDAEGKPYGVFNHVIDVTEREKERVLRERFISTLTHDLRTPLTAAKISAQLLCRKITNPESGLALAKRIISNINRADRMIRDLLDSNRFKAGEGIPIIPEKCDLKKVVESVVRELKELHGPRFIFVGNTGEVLGFWDRTCLQRLIENLSDNAIKYGLQNAQITISLINAEDWVEIVVHNLGNPISHEDQKNLFNPYRRTDSAASSEHRGWGIGLMIVRGVAEAHGGKVRVESSQENGTTFCVRFPLKGKVPV